MVNFYRYLVVYKDVKAFTYKVLNKSFIYFIPFMIYDFYMSSVIHTLPKTTLLTNWFKFEGAVALAVIASSIYVGFTIKVKNNKDFLKSIQRAYIFFTLNSFVLSFSNSSIFILYQVM